MHTQHRPRKGAPITYRGELVGYVSSVEGNTCYVSPLPEHADKYPKGAGFIWRFRDCLNELHDWPGKPSDSQEFADYMRDHFDHDGGRGPEASDCFGGATDCE